MQYENNPANGVRDIVRKRNTDAQPHGHMHGDDNILRPYFFGEGGGGRKYHFEKTKWYFKLRVSYKPFPLSYLI